MLSDTAGDFGATALGCGSDVYTKRSAWTMDPEELNVGDEFVPLGKMDVYDVLGAIDSPMGLEDMGLAGELGMAGQIDVYEMLGAISCVVSKIGQHESLSSVVVLESGATRAFGNFIGFRAISRKTENASEARARS